MRFYWILEITIFINKSIKVRAILKKVGTAGKNILLNFLNMIRGNFIGAAIVAIIYTVYILARPLPTKTLEVTVLVILNALIIVLLAFAFK